MMKFNWSHSSSGQTQLDSNSSKFTADGNIGNREFKVKQLTAQSSGVMSFVW